MNVPLVVKIAIRMNANIATEGPASHSHQVIPRNPFVVSAWGPESMPIAARPMWRMPFGSLNQFGPLMPTHESTSFTTPVVEKRKSQSTVIATELVTDGK